MTTLYHYVHCPFCLRIRMAFGLLKIPYIDQVLPYNDEKTPLSLMGKKMLPIVKFEDQTLNESLDIIKKADGENTLRYELLKEKGEELEELLTRLGGPVHNLAMPYWVYTQEFDNDSRTYFLAKKEAKRGPFSKLMTKAPEFLSQLAPILSEVEDALDPFLYGEQSISLLDIMLASHLWGLYIYPEFQFSEKLHHYLQDIKQQCSFNYHESFWEKN